VYSLLFSRQKNVRRQIVFERRFFFGETMSLGKQPRALLFGAHSRWPENEFVTVAFESLSGLFHRLVGHCVWFSKRPFPFPAEEA
jgi:hypothetical protein